MSELPQMIAPVDHIEPVPRRMRAVLAGQVVLDTTTAARRRRKEASAGHSGP